MALPFFRKGKDKPPAPAAKAIVDPDTQPGETLLTMDMRASGIVVEETSGAPQSPTDEAAILYASGQAESTEQLLHSMLGSDNRRAWLMLLDLYRVQNRDKDFDKLALEYAVRFELSPPVWQRIGSSPAAAKPQTQTESLELPGLLDRKSAASLLQSIAATPKNAPVRIDFSHIEMVDEAGAEECVRILSSARRTKRKMQVSGVDRFITLLQDLNRATHSRAVHWLLLLEIYQTLGQQENFENLAVDYAVRFEVSPPSWSDVLAAEVVPAAASEPQDDALRLSGEIGPANTAALQQIGSYVAEHSNALIDMGQVTRVDYGTVSQLIGVLMQGLSSGKTVILRGHNALIHELFRVMGIDQLAQLVPYHPD